MRDEKLAAAIAKLNEIRGQRAAREAQKAAAKDAGVQRACRCRFEKVWPAGTTLATAARDMGGDAINEFSHNGRVAASQIRSDDLARTNGVPYRIFVELADGRIACCTATKPCFSGVSYGYLAALAHEEAAVSLDRLEAKRAALTWGVDGDGEARRPWWNRD